MLLDQEHGLLPYAPIYLLVPAGLLALRRTAHGLAPAIFVAAYLAPVLCPWLNVHGWSGGWSPAARLLVPVVPFLAIAAFAAIVHGHRAAAGALALVQVGIDQLLWRQPRLAWNAGDGHAEFADALFPGAAAWLPRWAPGGGVIVTVAFVAGWLALAALSDGAQSRRSQIRPALRAARPEK
jgi:hypothetical protein